MIKRARERKTSAVILHFTKVVRASRKDENTSRENDSALRASRNRLTIPMQISISKPCLQASLTHPEQAA